MNYEQIIKEIEKRAIEAQKVAARVIGYPYKCGSIDGITSEDGIGFYFYDHGDIEHYYIPFHWLEKSEEELEDFLYRYKKEKEEKEALERARKEAERKQKFMDAERATYEMLKKKYEGESK